MSFKKTKCEVLCYSPTENIDDYEWLKIQFPQHHKFFTRYIAQDNSWNICGWTK
jgi:hypothetical protein